MSVQDNLYKLFDTINATFTSRREEVLKRAI